MEFEAAKKALITALAGKKSFAIGYHPDADGIAGTALLIKYLKKQGAAREEIDLYPINNLHRSFSETHLNQIMAAKYDAIIYIDCAISDNEQISRVAAHFKPVICIDHHHYQRGLEAIPHLYINSVDFAGMTKPDLFTTSKLMHAMFYDPSDDWLELLGLEGDVVIQSIKGSLIYEAAQRLNMLGLVEEYGASLKVVTERRNGLVALLLDAEDVSDLLRRIAMDKQLESLYEDIIGDIAANLNVLKQAKPKLTFDDNKIFTHKISTVKGFDI
ncbi:MAG: DHH family phosphoesterase, partial [Deltaproteobacteria bacterium]|nr:DHH family phosphoesterase [Deltaproteobacteria bacterium]